MNQVTEIKRILDILGQLGARACDRRDLRDAAEIADVCNVLVNILIAIGEDKTDSGYDLHTLAKEGEKLLRGHPR